MVARVSLERCDFESPNFPQYFFVNIFFSLSKNCEQDSSDPEIINLLKELFSLEYTINKKSAVFDNQLGKQWPCLERSGSVSAIGSAISSRSGEALGEESLKGYLQSRKQMVVIDRAQQKILSEQHTSSSSSSSLSERTVEKQDASSSASKPAEVNEFKRTVEAVKGNISFLGALPFRLENFRAMGLFLELPKEELNSFTVDDLLGSSLTLYQGGYCLLQKNKEILAYTPGLVIKTPAFEYLETKMDDKFMEGQWVSIDDPCDLPREIQTELEDASALEEMLPFFKGLIPHQKG